MITHKEWDPFHYDDAIMGTMASQITSLTIVYSTVYLDADQRKCHRSASLAFVREFHRGPVNSPHKWPVTWKMFPFDYVITEFYIIVYPKLWGLVWKIPYRFEILPALWQKHYREACEIWEQSSNSMNKFRCFEISRDLTMKRLVWYLNGTQVKAGPPTANTMTWTCFPY